MAGVLADANPKALVLVVLGAAVVAGMSKNDMALLLLLLVGAAVAVVVVAAGMSKNRAVAWLASPIFQSPWAAKKR